jgi:hypothetical protein
VGAIDPFTVTVDHKRAPRSVEAFPVPGRAATAVINGRTVQKELGRFLFRQDGVELALQFAPGFEGTFDRFTISAAEGHAEPPQERLTEAEANEIRELVEPLFSLATGGENANLKKRAGRAIRLSATILAELAKLGATGSGGAARRSLAKGSILDQLI